MRIARLDLPHYGKFTDASFAFRKAGGGDLQFIVGPNEAGKSTLRSAILEFLYGIGKSSPYGYRGLSDLKVDALIETEGESITLRRVKTRSLKDSLEATDGTKLDLSVLARLMGNADEDFYRRMFGLNHTELVKGGREMLNSSGDVGEMLFQAAAGVTGLRNLRERLLQDASELWTPRSNGSCAYWIAKKKFSDGHAMLKHATVTANLWLKSKRTLEDAEAARDEARARHTDTEREHTRLERIRRALPFLREHEEASAQLDALGAPPLLPVNARTTLEDASAKLAATQGQIDLLTTRFQEETEALAAIPVNAALLESKGEIDALGSRLQTYLDALRDRPELVKQQERNEEKARRLATQLGWSEIAVEAIAARVPSKLARNTLTTFAQQQPTLVSAAEQAQQKLQDTKDSIKTLEDKIAGAGAHPLHAGLSAAAKAATALNLPVRGPAAKAKVSTTKAKMDAAFAALAPWTGSEPALRAMVLPVQSELQSFTDRRAVLVSRTDQAKETYDAKVIEVAKAKGALDAFARQHLVVTAEALDNARRSRDDLWQKVRQGGSVAEIGDQYEARVQAADGVADQRFDGVAMIERHDTLVTVHDTLAAEVNALATQITKLGDEMTDLQDRWQAGMQALGLKFTQPQLVTWSALRDAALIAANAFLEAKTAHDALAEEAGHVESVLRKELADAGETPPAGADVTLLAAQAEAAIKARADAATRVAEWNDQLRTDRNGLSALVRKQEEAAGAVEAWASVWGEKLKTAGLPGDLTPMAISSVVETLADIEEACRDVLENARPRVGQMEREITTFTDRANALAQSCAPEATNEAPEKIVPRLRELLRDAEIQSKKLLSAQDALAKTRKALENAAEDKTKAEGELAPLYELAHVKDVPSLTAAIVAAERYRAVQARIERADTAARQSGDNRPLAELIAERDTTDVDSIDDLLAHAATAREEARVAHDAAIVTHTRAKAEFEKIAGQDDAVRAESLRREGLLGMNEAVDEYVKVTVAEKLVKWAVDRYSEEKQQPLLKHASTYFSMLTDGRFSKLAVNFDAEPAALVAHPSDGSTFLTVKGMSTGTEDQLYLALRLAALDLHLDAGTPLPLILDDIFINWSDKRAAAGFKVLAQISQRTQVILLSHHEHLVKVANGAVGERINVISLAV